MYEYFGHRLGQDGPPKLMLMNIDEKDSIDDIKVDVRYEFMGTQISDIGQTLLSCFIMYFPVFNFVMNALF